MRQTTWDMCAEIPVKALFFLENLYDLKSYILRQKSGKPCFYRAFVIYIRFTETELRQVTIWL